MIPRPDNIPPNPASSTEQAELARGRAILEQLILKVRRASQTLPERSVGNLRRDD